jgi:hypothetical protein
LARVGQFVVAPTKGALVPGWLLVISESHAVCAGALPSEALEGLPSAVEAARTLVERHFGPATIFEHGPARSGCALGCGIDHAHVHVASLPFSLVDAVDAVVPGVEWRSLNAVRSVDELHATGLDYCVVQEPACQAQWFSAPRDVRQLFRRAIATALGRADRFDYALYPEIENVRATLTTLLLE